VADHCQWPIIVIGAVALLFVGAAARRVLGIMMRLTFSPRVLEHLSGLTMLIGQWFLRLHLSQVLCLLLQLAPPQEHRGAAQLQLPCQPRTALALTKTAQQQHDLGRCQATTGPHRAA